MMTRWAIRAYIAGVLGGVLIVVLFVVSLTSSSQSASACPAGQVQPVNITGVTSLDTASLRNAGSVIAQGQSQSVPTRGIIVALSSALQESHIHNLANTNVPESLVIPNDGMGSDHDSVGIEQQRPSWGSVQDRMTPATAARFFFEHLLKIPGWEAMPVTVAAQHVQGSAFPDAYAKWEPLATQLVANAGLTPLNTGCTPGLTTTVSGAAGIAIQNAESKVGTAYQFGGSCLDPHSTVMSGHCDCSSLVMTAWAAAGKVLPRTSEAQYDAVQHITASPTTFAGLEPGDLLFYEPGGDGISGKPAHVAMYIGGGKLIEAPKPGDIVHVIPVYSGTWLGAGRVS